MPATRAGQQLAAFLARMSVHQLNGLLTDALSVSGRLRSDYTKTATARFQKLTPNEQAQLLVSSYKLSRLVLDMFRWCKVGDFGAPAAGGDARQGGSS
jgi:hypothetical protein